MRDQLAALAKLSEIDAAARDFDAELKELPERIEEMRSDVKRIEALLAHERAQLEELLGLKRTQQSDMASRNEALARAKAKAAKARTAKEAEAAERELETNRRGAKEREDEIARLDEVLTKVQGQLGEHEKELDSLRELFRKEEEQAKGRVAELEAQRAEVVHGRDDVTVKLPRPLVQRYERIRQQRGAGVVIITDDTCSGCSMRLAPQLYIEVQRAQEIHQCPACLRFIVYKPLIED